VLLPEQDNKLSATFAFHFENAVVDAEFVCVAFVRSCQVFRDEF